MLRLSFKALSELLILSCNSNRTCILVADSHHHAAHAYKWRCGKAKFLSSKKCRNGNVSTCHELTVSFKDYVASKAAVQKGLMGFTYPKLPRKSCVVNGR